MQKNNTIVNMIFLLGFRNLPDIKIPLFCCFLLIYILTVFENILLIVLVSTSQRLQSPMYFFLRQLSMCDLLQTASIVPLMLINVMNSGVNVSLIGCLTQLYFFACSEALQSLILSVMSYDRYLAICNPLHHTFKMSQRVSSQLISVSCVLSFSIPILTVTLLGGLQFCKGNVIDHFFCDVTPLLELSCSDTSLAKMVFILISIPTVISPFFLIIVTYICIVRTILQIESNIRREKAFSTCSSHLAVVSIFYGTLFGIYVVPPRKELWTISKFLSLLYTVVIPFINPIIYSFRNKLFTFHETRIFLNFRFLSKIR